MALWQWNRLVNTSLRWQSISFYNNWAICRNRNSPNLLTPTTVWPGQFNSDNRLLLPVASLLFSKPCDKTKSLHTEPKFNRYKHSSHGSRQGNHLVSILALSGVFLGYVLTQLKKPESHIHSQCWSEKPLDREPALDANRNGLNKEPQNNSAQQDTNDYLTLAEAMKKGGDLIKRIKDETGSPGLVLAVTVDGKTIWTQGLGYADMENRVLCTPDTIMRIASISKAITMTIVARLLEQGKLDLDKPVQFYVPGWPEKTFEGQKIQITTRQLVSHLGGIRHYDKNCGRKENDAEKSKLLAGNTEQPTDIKTNKKSLTTPEFEHKEYYIKRHYSTVAGALDLFKNDELCSLPGSKYLYTTHGWTLISAVIEGASGKKFPQLVKNLFQELGMQHTYLDENDPIIYHRARFYEKNKQGRIVNAPYVDNSYKWAGGGILSDVSDLVKFGNAMLYSHQWTQDARQDSRPGYLKSDTMAMLWSPVTKTKCDEDASDFYGMGWAVMPHYHKYGQCKESRFSVNHTGAAVGASSVLLILPRREGEATTDNKGEAPLPQGVVVAVVANLTSVSLKQTALEIAKLFEKVKL